MEKDFLRNYPSKHTPPAWELNAVFLKIMERAQARWEKKGYTWEVGLECSFELPKLSNLTFPDMTPDQLAHTRTIQGNRILHDLWQTDIPKDPDIEFHRGILSLLLQRSDDIAAMNGINAETVLEDLKAFESDLDTDSDEDMERAIQNIYLAWLHATPSSEGGLQDLIEPRFGDYMHGVGWWDAYMHAEVRIPRTSNLISFIETYHKILGNIIESAPRFGLAPDFTVHTPHIHFSIWKDGQALLRPDHETKTFRQHVAMGLSDIAINAPFLMNDAKSSYSTEGQFEFGSWRVKTGFRQLENRWEYRRHLGANEAGFLSRDMAYLLSGSLLAIESKDVKKSFRDFRKTQGFGYTRQLEVEHGFGDTQNSLRAAIAHAELNKKNFLRPNLETLDWLLYSLTEEVGQHAVSDFKSNSHHFEPLYDLKTEEGWRKLISSLSYDPEKGLETGHLSPELQSLFDLLDIKRVQSFISSVFICVDLDTHTYLDILHKKRPWIVGQSVDEREWSEIEAHYKGYFEQGFSKQAEILIGQLSDKFNKASSDVEDPRPIVEQELSRIQFESAAKFISELFANMAKNNPDQEPYVSPKGRISREVLTSRPSYLQKLQPHFHVALDRKIEDCRLARSDNRQIFFLETAREYLEEKWFSFDVFEDTVRRWLDETVSRIRKHDMSWRELHMDAIVNIVYLEEISWQCVYDKNITDEDLPRMFEKNYATWKKFFSQYQESQDDEIKMSPLWQEFYKEFSALMEASYQEKAALLLPLGKKNPEVAPGFS